MSSNRDNYPSFPAGARMNYSATDSVQNCQRLWWTLARALAPAENVKGQYRAIYSVTGISPRRQKDIRAAKLKAIADHEATRLRHALLTARERAKQQWVEIERDAADVERWFLASSALAGAHQNSILESDGSGSGQPSRTHKER